MSLFTISRSAGTAMAALAAPLLVAGCSFGGDGTPAAQADTVTITDHWVKAADSGMSAAFADFTNTSDHQARIVGASSPVAARMEIHEVANVDGATTMRPKTGGLVIPAHGSAALKPGADHLMFIDLTGPLRTGSDVPVTLTFSDGSSRTFTTQVRDFSGNRENYTGATRSADHSG